VLNLKKAILALALVIFGGATSAMPYARGELSARLPASIDVADGAGAPSDSLLWSALVETVAHLSVADCSASRLSTRFILTAWHCVNGVPIEDVYVTRPGNFSHHPSEAEGFASVEDVYFAKVGNNGEKTALGVDRDLALLQLKTPLPSKVDNFPLYHGYSFRENTPVAIFRSGSQDKINKKLRWAAMMMKEHSAQDKYGGPAFRLSRYAVMPTVPYVLPPAGYALPGDSGGTVHAFLCSDYLPKNTPLRKAIGVGSSGHPEGRAYYTKLDDEVVRWLGKRVVMITAPRDGQVFYGGEDIPVSMTDVDSDPLGKAQPVKNVALIYKDERGDDVTSVCSRSQIKLLPTGDLGCQLSHANENATFSIRVYREGDTSYDEVTIFNRANFNASLDEKNSGLSIEMPSTNHF